MTIASLPPAVRQLCTQCHGQNPRCGACLGEQYVAKDPYAEGGGEQGDDFADLSGFTAVTLDEKWVERWLRILELARVVRSPENSAPLTELLDLIEGER